MKQAHIHVFLLFENFSQSNNFTFVTYSFHLLKKKLCAMQAYVFLLIWNFNQSHDIKFKFKCYKIK